jgi:hypothetical protein
MGLDDFIDPKMMDIATEGLEASRRFLRELEVSSLESEVGVAQVLHSIDLLGEMLDGASEITMVLALLAADNEPGPNWDEIVRMNPKAGFVALLMLSVATEMVERECWNE